MTRPPDPGEPFAAPVSMAPVSMASGSVAPGSVAAAEGIQEQLRQRLDLHEHLTTAPRLVAGIDVSYDKSSPRVTAAAVVFDLATGVEVESAVVPGEVTFPYVPGLLAFREVPILLTALDRLATPPDLVVCDGYGIAHPRRFGLACHLGVVTGLPTFGVAKTPSSPGTTSRAGAGATGRRCGPTARCWAGCCVPRPGSSRCSCRWATAPPSTRRPP